MQTVVNHAKGSAWARMLGPLSAVAVAGLSAYWLTAVLAELVQRWRAGTPLSVRELVMASCGGLALLLLSWLLLAIALELAATLPGAAGRVASSLSRRLVPALGRQAVAIALGVASVGACGPAPDAPGPAVRPSSVVASALATLPDPGWVPAPPVVRPQADPRPLIGGQRPATAPPGWVVRQGDTLWDIALAHLHPDATVTEVAAEWPRWYAANRAVIGPDPDLLQPGQVLRAPTAAQAPAS